jgi:protein-S-isoprenylcysteine O-methyltransferase Ste14
MPEMIDPVQVLLFIVLSAVAVAASLNAWRTRTAYGLFRFFAFEFLALLIVWNASRWFRDPLSIQQIVSWIIFAASTMLAAHGLHLLRSLGKAQRRVMEDTETVVEVGAYRFIRHPLYASLLFIGWGVFFKGLDWPSGALALAATAFWIATARYEERFNIDRFGVAYSEYMKRTKMFVPFLL